MQNAGGIQLPSEMRAASSNLEGLAELLGKSPPVIQGVALQEQELALAPGQICVGPHCQCFGEDSELARNHTLPDD